MILTAHTENQMLMGFGAEAVVWLLEASCHLPAILCRMIVRRLVYSEGSHLEPEWFPMYRKIVSKLDETGDMTVIDFSRKSYKLVRRFHRCMCNRIQYFCYRSLRYR